MASILFDRRRAHAKGLTMIRSLAAGLFTVAGLLPAAAQQPQWPPGDGREIVSVACVQCHVPSIIMNLREGPAGWRAHVLDMVTRGAQVKNSEVDAVVAYLASNFAPGTNLPTAKPVTLPDGDGKQLVEERCTACHDLQRVGTPRMGRNDWSRVVQHMVDIGAPLLPEEAKTVTAYLQAKLPGR
jgi:mono/diheme cytochrome c family protein